MLVVQEVPLGAGEVALYRELYAPTSVPVPELGEEPWPAPAGVLAGRRGGELVGWVVFFAGNNDKSQATLQWIMVRQERERITTGYHTTTAASTADVDDLTALASAAARQAQRAGYTHLKWGPAEPGLAEGIATRLNARTVTDEDGFLSYQLAW
ncbi:hypothetical protein [Streptomyces sp. S186]|uniref:hypothetical protein n=1 Tax=Streptomyces sp. S186 TaxID=3434395 RepID=UPI003F66F48D